MPQRFDIENGGRHGIAAGGRIGHDVAVIVDNMGVSAGNVDGVFHLWMQEHRADVGANHVKAVELCVPSVLDHPAAAARV